jgi:hypothetical protein
MKQLLVITTALLLGSLVLWRGRQESTGLRATATALQQRILTASNELATAQTRAESLRQDLERETAERGRLLAELADLGRRAPQAPAAPESALAVPPANLPAWDPDSPYVWLEKSLLPRLHFNGFLPDGSLDPEVAKVLTLEEADQRKLGESLKRIVAEHRREEMTHARVVEEHLPDVANKEGPKFTLRIEPMTEISTRLRAEFEAALVQHLGEQRAQFLKDASVSWLSDVFQEYQTESGTVSFVILPNGQFSMARRNGTGTMSASGSGDFRVYIPEHLHHLIPADFAQAAKKPENP